MLIFVAGRDVAKKPMEAKDGLEHRAVISEVVLNENNFIQVAQIKEQLETLEPVSQNIVVPNPI